MKCRYTLSDNFFSSQKARATTVSLASSTCGSAQWSHRLPYISVFSNLEKNGDVNVNFKLCVLNLTDCNSKTFNEYTSTDNMGHIHFRRNITKVNSLIGKRCAATLSSLCLSLFFLHPSSSSILYTMDSHQNYNFFKEFDEHQGITQPFSNHNSTRTPFGATMPTTSRTVVFFSHSLRLLLTSQHRATMVQERPAWQPRLTTLKTLLRLQPISTFSDLGIRPTPTSMRPTLDSNIVMIFKSELIS